MRIEKPQPLYNEQGQVKDSEIAEEMALHEEYLRKSPLTDNNVKKFGKYGQTKEGYIDQEVGKEAERNQKEMETLYDRQEFLKVSEKIINMLSEEEKSLIKRMMVDSPETLHNVFKGILEK